MSSPPPCSAYDWVCLADRHSGFAGYLQALGAIVIVFVAWSQGRAEARRAVAEQIAFISLCRDAAVDVYVALFPVLEWAAGRAGWKSEFVNLKEFYASSASDTLVRVLDFRLDRWPSLGLYKSLRGVQRAIAALRAELNATIDEGGLAPTKSTTARAADVQQALTTFHLAASYHVRQPMIQRLLAWIMGPLYRRKIIRAAVKVYRSGFKGRE